MFNILNFIFLIFLFFFIIINEYIIIKYYYNTYSFLLIFIYILPFLNIIFFFLIIKLSFKKKINKKIIFIKSFINYLINKIKIKQKKIYNKKYKFAKPLFKLLNKKKGINEINIFLKKKEFKIFSNTKKIFKKIIYDIKLAKKKIEIIFYIWKQGGIVNKIIEALINASKRGVCCRIILDSIGCYNFLYSNYFKKMCNAGIKIVKAFKINIFNLFLRRLDIRQHKKLILIDNNIVYTGSMNMVDNNCLKNKIFKYIDIMIRFKGKISNIMNIIYAFDWEMETGKKILFNEKYKKKKFFYNKKNQNFHIVSSIYNLSNKLIYKVFLTSIYSAKKKIIITSPYFIPTNELIEAICKVSLKGINVILILPKYNDCFMLSWANKYFFSKLLNSGVKIYKFKKGLLHTKSILIDEKVSIIGTVNFDIRSFYLNSEILLIIEDKKFSNIINQIHKQYIKKSKILNLKKWNKRSNFKKFFEFFFFLFSPIL
ncbi:cardiolipin synthase [Enterobacterales bacterium endosymbiont of Anomoneura mori]|uniref:cardiolipin synthase n=1 Tax=Enterobacterales bacterium endosymbiont of Anomoneura mori TaxID=3132096 RepID=UPI00399CB1B1